MKYYFLLLMSVMLCLTSCGKHSDNCVIIPANDGVLRLQLLADNAVRIQYYSNSDSIGRSNLPEWVYVNKKTEKIDWRSEENADGVVISTSALSVVYLKASGMLAVLDASGKEVFKASAHTLQASTVQGEPTFISTLAFESPKDESLFGLGQFQDEHTNLRGQSRRLTQVNTQIAMPFMLSSKGYALLWNNYGLVDFNPADSYVELQCSAAEGTQTTVDVTSTEGGKKEMRISNAFTAQIDIEEEGDYALLLDVGQTMARRHNLSIDNEQIIDVRNLWLPPTTSVVKHLTVGSHSLSAELERNDKPVVYYKRVTDTNVFRSPVSECVDYTVFVGTADQTISSYRALTGDSPMLPKWAFGYIHCRERYKSQQELLDNARTFRERNLPIDVIVQDWQYWGKYGWNAMKFDEQFYPEPDKMVEQLHDMDIRLMLSVWSKVDPASDLGKQIDSLGYFIPGTTWLDFFSKEVSDYYWDNFSAKLLKPYRIDAWWQDATEPENDDLVGRRVMNGTIPGEVFRNVYPLLVSKTVYEGLRKDDADRRAMILTRSGFPGIHRYGSVLWTGDVGNDWETLERQIASGLGMMSSGHPWWTYDAGGFFRPYDQYTNNAYIECMIRWIQTSVFFPLMRVHGYQSDTEPWRYGEEAENIIANSLELRYRLLPYIYSNAAKVSFDGSTLMRPLVFDFATDSLALQSKYSYMFGQSLLVDPVTKPNVEEWSTYLPLNDGGWYDFYTNRHYDGGANVSQEASIERIPVYVRAGSIVPWGPKRQSAVQKIDEPLVLKLYPGADAAFTLYDDEGDNYNYEEGAKSTIQITWNELTRQLVIDSRKGSYEGMEKQLRFVVEMPDGSTYDVEYNGSVVELTIASQE
jgi:alpha-D-xyloside xylohydrolase